MSLLMEALRKAEEAKRRGQLEPRQDPAANEAARSDNRPAASGQQAFALQEREPTVTPAYILDKFVGQTSVGQPAPALEPEPAPEAPGPAAAADLQDYLATAPETEDLTVPSSRQPVAGTGITRQQQAAASIFSAKRTPPKNRAMKILLASLLVLLLPAGGGLWWYLGQTASSGVMLNPSLVNADFTNRSLSDTLLPPEPEPAPASETAAAGEATGTIAATETVVAPEPEASAGAAAPEPDASAAIAADAVASTPDPVTPQPPSAVPGANEPAVAVTAPALSLPEPSGRTALQITRTVATRQDNAQLVAAYDRLQRGDLLVASQLYREVLNEFPNNRDAQLGLAQVSMRQGDPVTARTWYARLLQLNPRDPLARTGLLQTMQGVDPLEHENELRTLLAQYPEVAPLGFALGNLYATQQRWSEAQAAYFAALLTARRSGAVVHPDYAFNLAVSLEQLNQGPAALDYYRQANMLALEITPGFDLELLRSRLAYLEQPQP